MDWKKLGKSLLFPHIAIMLILAPISIAFLVNSMVFLGVNSIVAYASYALSAYTLTVWCLKIPYLIKLYKKFKNGNRYAIRWQEDTRLRINVFLFGALLWNVLYGMLQLWFGFYHSTFWFYSLGAYYICLGVMRFFLLRHTQKYAPGEKMQAELLKYRACGWIFLVMNLALALIVFFMLYFDRSFEHNMIVTIAMATYSFTALASAIINIVKYRQYKSPVFSASTAISLASACVSMLTLTSTMLSTFGDEATSKLSQKILLGCVGFAVSSVVVAIAIYMIVQGTKKLKLLKSEV